MMLDSRARRSVPLKRLVVAGWLMAAVSATASEPHVPYVPTAPNVVEAMLAIANVGPQDYVIDLGSGDGRILITAATRHGARGYGVDLNENLVARANEAARRAGVGERVAFQARNLFVTDLSQATVLTLYLFQSVNVQLRSRLFAELRPGARVVSHDFDMDEWQPDEQLTIPVPDKPYGPPESQVFLWVIPANAAGTWLGTVGAQGDAAEFQAELTQTFQLVSGTARVDKMAGKVRTGRLRGHAVRFALDVPVAGRGILYEFEGQVEGETLVGTVRVTNGAVHDWRARRIRSAPINLSAAPKNFDYAGNKE